MASNHHCNNSWRLLAVFLTCLLAFCTDIVHCMTLPPISWNASNPMFKTSNNDHVIQVNMYDDMDFVCPQAETDADAMEYYVIYQVSKREYEECSIYPESKAIMIVNCSNPSQRIRFTLLFEPFASIPHVPEFKYGASYYYISTSTGQRDGIANSQQGACFYRNMKLTITVCCASTSSTPEPEAQTTTLAPNSTSNIYPTTQTPLAVTSADIVSEDEDLYTEATTRRPPTTGHVLPPSASTRQPGGTPHRTRPTPAPPSTKHTDNVWDKTSTRPTKNKPSKPGDENNIHKPGEDSNVSDPKKLTNAAGSLRGIPAHCSTFVLRILLHILPWLPWRWR